MTHRKTNHLRIHKLKRTYNRNTNTFTFNITYETTPQTQTPRTQEVAENFGLGTDQTQKFTLYHNLNLHIHPTDIVLITGDSGSGKSALLKAIKTDLGKQAKTTTTLHTNKNTPIIETLGKNTNQALQLLSKVGLNDAFLFLRNYNQLSDGQKHRSQIARLAQTPAKWWLLDEFTSTLDRDTAKIVAYNLQRLARERHISVIAATTQTDLLPDLAPNVHIQKRFGDEVTVNYYPNNKADTCTLTNEMQLTEATPQDYKQLSKFHYRNAHSPAPRKTFTLKRHDETCGIIIYGYPPPTCFGRSKMWKGNLTQLNQEISTITRAIIHPKYRGIGLGKKIVAETLKQAGTPNVETIAVMARINPFFEHAGMQRIAQSKPSQPIQETLKELKKIGFDTNLLNGTAYTEPIIKKVGCQTIQTLLTELSKHDGNIRKRLASLQTVYPKHDEFTKKIQESDAASLALMLKRLSFAAQAKVYLFWRNPEG